MNKRIRIAVPVVVVVALATWYFGRSGPDAASELAASGTIEATDADLGFQAPGRLVAIAVREGDRVEAGQELARLDAEELVAAVDAARAQVAAAEARLAELRAGARPQEIATADAGLLAAERQVEDARRDADRATELFEGGAISRQALDKATTALEVASATRDQAEERRALVVEGPRTETLRAQEALVQQARAQQARAEAALSNALVVAPFAGLVTRRHREPGETVALGAPVLTLLDPDDRWVRIYVREDQIGRVRIGQPAEVFADSHPGRAYEGEVVFIGSEAEFTPRNVQTAEERTKLVYPVKVRITGDADFDLKPGTPADVSLSGGGS